MNQSLEFRDCADESISTLTFADRAKKVKIRAQVNEFNAADDVLVRKLQGEVQYLRNLLQLRRKGGFSDLNRQLVSLKHENTALKKNQTISQVENLKSANQNLRLQLQSLKYKPSSTSVTNSVVNFNPQAHHQLTLSSSTAFTSDYSRNPQMYAASPNSPPSPRSSLPQISHLSQSPVKLGNQTLSPYKAQMLESIEGGAPPNAQDITYVLEQQRLMKIAEAGEKLRSTMSQQNRCPICTLPLPCKHYANFAQIKASRDDALNTQSVDQIPQFMQGSPYRNSGSCSNDTGRSANTSVHNEMIGSYQNAPGVGVASVSGGQILYQNNGFNPQRGFIAKPKVIFLVFFLMRFFKGFALSRKRKSTYTFEDEEMNSVRAPS